MIRGLIILVPLCLPPSIQTPTADLPRVDLHRASRGECGGLGFARDKEGRRRGMRGSVTESIGVVRVASVLKGRRVCVRRAQDLHAFESSRWRTPMRRKGRVRCEGKDASRRGTRAE
ncbi:uncharacterized protein C8Q71DRAFT_751791 [Rhodofomes roseus]|uniref:Secreted protein n=1 Tax=Rhodofomes roseus TaxID=34475 RepID=A0ABQ8KK75_9APHY|nr:uncharacterized protein C8Q71DRAFT_784669 [Rhodofomes roseus]XP_047780468.1 uncharacterized protein C8Q71DRAFT_751791 [Rhodofomes roseus]KAH9830801.1 hypothetical protein C8Q71DRAFT_784669 [Rhodofomes roseus]KAH9838553.1 hypothetical protein C8Q71DRAFT_751791 [Rhodofomes roseus]